MLRTINEQLICVICFRFFNTRKRAPIACPYAHCVCLDCIKQHDKVVQTGNLDILHRRKCFFCKSRYTRKPTVHTQMRGIGIISTEFRKYVKVKNNEVNGLKRKVRLLEAKVAKQDKQLGKKTQKKLIVPHVEPIPTPPPSSSDELDHQVLHAPISCGVIERAFASHLATNPSSISLSDIIGDVSLDVFFAEDFSEGEEVPLSNSESGTISPSPPSAPSAVAATSNANTASRANSEDASASDAGGSTSDFVIFDAVVDMMADALVDAADVPSSE